MNLSSNSTLPFWEQAESRRPEFKEGFPLGNQVAKTVIAFANGAGGKLVFGVRNKPRQILGIPDEELFSLEEWTANHIFTQCTPPIIPEIYIQSVAKKNLLVVEIFPSFHKPYYLKTEGKHKGTYIRIGSTNKQASLEVLEELERQRRIDIVKNCSLLLRLNVLVLRASHKEKKDFLEHIKYYELHCSA